MGAAWGQSVDSGARTGEFAGKVVIAGSGLRWRPAIDIIRDAIERKACPSSRLGETSRQRRTKSSRQTGGELIYVNSDIAHASAGAHRGVLGPAGHIALERANITYGSGGAQASGSGWRNAS